MSDRSRAPVAGPATRSGLRVLCLIGVVFLLWLAGPGPSSASSPAGARQGSLAGSVHGRGPRLIDQELPGEEAYRQHCTICHGQQGRGDGPAAAAFDPSPPDFASPESVVLLSDDEVLEIVVKGRRAMPAFETVLEPELLPMLVGYVRDLSNVAD